MKPHDTDLVGITLGTVAQGKVSVVPALVAVPLFVLVLMAWLCLRWREPLPPGNVLRLEDPYFHSLSHDCCSIDPRHSPASSLSPPPAPPHDVCCFPTTPLLSCPYAPPPALRSLAQLPPALTRTVASPYGCTYHRTPDQQALHVLTGGRGRLYVVEDRNEARGQLAYELMHLRRAKNFADITPPDIAALQKVALSQGYHVGSMGTSARVLIHAQQQQPRQKGEIRRVEKVQTLTQWSVPPSALLQDKPHFEGDELEWAGDIMQLGGLFLLGPGELPGTPCHSFLHLLYCRYRFLLSIHGC